MCKETIDRIEDAIESIAKFNFATSIDLAMSYYALRSSERAREMCGIFLPWGTCE